MNVSQNTLYHKVYLTDKKAEIKQSQRFNELIEYPDIIEEPRT